MKKKSSKIPPKYLDLFVLFSAIVVSFFLWNTYLLFPIKMFTVIWHEISHGLAEIFTGGRIESIEFSLDFGGRCYSGGGNEFIVASSGYLGSLFIGYALFRSSFDEKASRWTCTALAAILIIMASNFVSSLVGGLISILFSLLLYISPRYFNKNIHKYIWRILGVISALYVLIDINQDVLLSNNFINDASRIEYLTNISATIWGVLWFFLTIATIIYMIVYDYKNA